MLTWFFLPFISQSGRGGESIANSIASTLAEAFDHSFDFSQLCVLENKFAWCINVDILILEVGSKSTLFDACSVAVKTALINAR